MPFFDSVERMPDDPILGLAEDFKADTRPEKVNLGVGTYKNAEGKPQVLSCVRKAEAILFEQNLNMEYLPILGDGEFIEAAQKLVFGKNSPQIASRSLSSAQTIGASGALRMGGEFLFRNQICDIIYMSDPSWPNHRAIFNKSGMKTDFYTYYDTQSHSLNFSGMCDAISKIPPGTAILFQPSCHNPTGLDPSFDEWKEIEELVKHHQLVPFFDLPYQGFAKNVEEDAQVVRYFAEKGHEMLVATSFSKNFGLYGERVGMLTIISGDQDTSIRVSSQVKQMIRGCYSTPPLQGERVVTMILQSDEMREEWLHELENMRIRINEMRKGFVSGLQAKGSGDSFNHLAMQTGMFSFSGLNEEQVHQLKSDYGVYMLKNGRMNVAGLNAGNMDYVIDAFLSVI